MLNLCEAGFTVYGRCFVSIPKLSQWGFLASAVLARDFIGFAELCRVSSHRSGSHVAERSWEHDQNENWLWR